MFYGEFIVKFWLKEYLQEPAADLSWITVLAGGKIIRELFIATEN